MCLYSSCLTWDLIIYTICSLSTYPAGVFCSQLKAVINFRCKWTHLSITVTRVQRYLSGYPLGFSGCLPLKYRVKGSKQNMGFIIRALDVKVK